MDAQVGKILQFFITGYAAHPSRSENI